MGAMRRAVHLALRRWWLGGFVAAAVVAVLAEPKAQPGPSEEAQVLAADESLGVAMRAGDRSIARRLLSLQFTFVDANGKVHVRRDFLADLKSDAPASASGATVKVYGLVGVVTGHRVAALGDDTFFLDIWAKQKRAWRALAVQEVVLGAAEARPDASAALAGDAALSACRNPCETIPYRVRSPAEQDVVNAFQAVENATFAHDAAEWRKRVADEFVHYRSGHAPMPRAEGVALIEDHKERNIPAVPSAVQSMRLWVYGNGAAMISTNGVPDESKPLLRVARAWVKRDGQWQMAISAQTDVK